MDEYTIKIDGKFYGGEDPERTYSTNYGGNGWHVSNHRSADHLIIGADEPKLLVGSRGLMGAIERIQRYIRDGYIDPSEIVISRKQRETK